jgi:hypothetical protein
VREVITKGPKCRSEVAKKLVVSIANFQSMIILMFVFIFYDTVSVPVPVIGV